MAGSGRGRGRPFQLSDEQREVAVEQAGLMARRGFSVREIGRMLKDHIGHEVSHVTVLNLLQGVKADYARRVADARPLLLQEKLDQLRDVRREAWAAYEASKGGTEKVVEECAPPLKPLKGGTGPGGANGRAGTGMDPRTAARAKAAQDDLVKLRVTITRDRRGPADRYLGIVLKTLEVECELLGLYPVEGGGLPGGEKPLAPVDWDALAVAPDRAEAELERLEERAGLRPPALPPPPVRVLEIVSAPDPPARPAEPGPGPDAEDMNRLLDGR